MNLRPRALICDPAIFNSYDIVNSLSKKFEIYLVEKVNKIRQFILLYQIHILLLKVSEKDLADNLYIINEIKKDSELSEIPVIVFLDEYDKHVVMKCISSGAHDFMLLHTDSDLFVQKIYNLTSYFISIRAKSYSFFSRYNKVPEKDYLFSDFEKEVIHILNNDLDYSIKDIADKLSVSIATLERAVKKATGITPNNYLIKQKLERANILIGSKKFRLKEVAFMVGFSSASHFTRTYKKYFGLTPTDNALV